MAELQRHRCRNKATSLLGVLNLNLQESAPPSPDMFLLVDFEAVTNDIYKGLSREKAFLGPGFLCGKLFMRGFYYFSGPSMILHAVFKFRVLLFGRMLLEHRTNEKLP